MLIATIKGSPNRPGKKITFDAGQFSVEGLGPVEVDAVVELDRQGRLVWPDEGMRAWVLAQLSAKAMTGGPPSAVVTVSPPAAAATVGPLASSASTGTLTSGWAARCPACRQSALRAGEPKKSFWSQSTRQVWVCPQCRATFVEKGSGFELSGADAPGAQMVQRFEKQVLTPAEWGRVAAGGQSDGEIALADLQHYLDAVRMGNARFAEVPEASVTLKRGEEIVAVCSEVTLREPRTVTHGVYGGPRMRVSRSLSFNLGAFRAAPHEELRDVDKGSFVLTDKRYIFMGSKRTASASLSMIVGVEPYQDAIAIHRSNKQRMEMFCGLGSEQFSFSVEGRDHTAALNGAVLAYLIEGLAAGDAAAGPAPSARSPRGNRGGGGVGAGSTADEIEKLVKLRDGGALTDVEFAALKAKLIHG